MVQLLKPRATTQEHPETALAWSALGHVRLSLSEHAVAMDCFKQGLAIARKVEKKKIYVCRSAKTLL
eukprot:1802691-Rhodomonas_salina.1